jgi:hypothetical protein
MKQREGMQMSLRAKWFVDTWITKNVRKGPGNSSALAIRLLIEANAHGIPSGEITAECCDPKITIERVLRGGELDWKTGFVQ